MLLAEVALPLPIDSLYTYFVPEELKGHISVGGRVLVPLRSKKELIAYVLGLREGVRQDLRPIISPLEGIPLFPPQMIPLFEWLSSYYVYPIGKVITEILPFKGKRAPSIELSVWRDPEALKGLSEEERDAIASISKRKRKLRLDLTLIGEMLKKGYLSIRGPKTDFGQRPRSFPNPITLTRHQESALREIGRAVRESRFEVFLLHGVTGSGKTQVYIEAIKEALSVRRSAIILFPEISLGLYMEALLRSVFGEKLSLYHSHLGNRQRQSQWMGMLWGHYQVVLGARSAVFAPFRDIGVIIVDEEHEDSYKQESGLRYNGRDVAVLRGMISRCPVILGSATPSIRSYFNALCGKYHLVEMPERVEERPLPSVELVDMASLRKETKTFVLISPRTQEAISQALSLKRQVIVFHNRRGFFRMFLCQTCGSLLKCPDCDLAMIYHLDMDSLVCHYCNRTLPILKLCPSCKKETLKPYGYGTERIVEELRRLFPEYRVERIDTDVQRREDLLKILEDFGAKNIDILVGTQLITKGYDFPNVTLVAIISSDSLLNFPDYRSSERTFSTIAQVAGRSGRGDDPGRVIIQSYNSWHHSVRCAVEHDYKSFYEKEIGLRQKLFYPPFSHIVMITLSGPNKIEVFERCRTLKGILTKALENSPIREQVVLYGPTPNPISRLKNRYRFHLLLKTTLIKELTMILKGLNLRDLIKGKMSLVVDVDPYDML